MAVVATNASVMKDGMAKCRGSLIRVCYKFVTISAGVHQ